MPARPVFSYVLTSDGRDHPRRYDLRVDGVPAPAHPEGEIVLLCDDRSERALREHRHRVLEQADRVVGVATPEGWPASATGFVKTSQRRHIAGDFVYLDADTAVVRRIDELLACPASVAGVANMNGTGSADELIEVERAFIRSVGWPLPEKPFINGGVLLVRDDPGGRRFGAIWHERWLESGRATGKHFDQPALNRALADSGVDYAVLDSRFNAQVLVKPTTARGAHVWHFYASLERDRAPWTVLEEAMEALERRGRLAPRLVDRLARRPLPWIALTPLDPWIIGKLERDPTIGPNNMNDPKLLWLGNRRRTTAGAVRRFVWPAVTWRLGRLRGRLSGPVARRQARQP